MKSMRRDEKGFTLIELLIVIIILGILAVIGIPKFMNSKKEAIVKACQTNRSSLEDAGERYFFDCGEYPAGDEDDCQADLTEDSDVSGWNGPYIKAAFTCPYDGEETYTFDEDNGAVSCSNVPDNHDKTYSTSSSSSSDSESGSESG
jgi:type II secretion system protein G